MVNTRSDEIQALIESKLEIKELQLSLIDKVKKILLKLFWPKLKKLLKRPILQHHVKNLKQQDEILLQRCEKNEQYGRRLCVRITGIPLHKNESVEDVRYSVKSNIEESGCDIPVVALDRSRTQNW